MTNSEFVVYYARNGRKIDRCNIIDSLKTSIKSIKKRCRLAYFSGNLTTEEYFKFFSELMESEVNYRFKYRYEYEIGLYKKDDRIFINSEPFSNYRDKGDEIDVTDNPIFQSLYKKCEKRYVLEKEGYYKIDISDQIKENWGEFIHQCNKVC